MSQAIETIPNPTPAPKQADKTMRRKYGLRIRQWRFLKYYMGRANGNATRAYELAGYSANSEQSLGVCACQLLGNPKIQRALEAELAKGYGPADIVGGLSAIAKANSADWVGVDPITGKGSINLAKMQAAGAMGLIESYTMDKDGIVKVKLYSRTRAMEILARINGMILDKREISGPNGGPIPVEHKVITDDDIIRARQVASERTVKALPATGKGENGNGNGNGH